MSETVTLPKAELYRMLDIADEMVRFCSVNMPKERYDAVAASIWVIAHRGTGNDAVADQMAKELETARVAYHDLCSHASGAGNAAQEPETVENLRHTRDLWFKEATRLRGQLNAVRAALTSPAPKREVAPEAGKEPVNELPEGYTVEYGSHRSWHAYHRSRRISAWGYKADAVKACWEHSSKPEAAA